MSPADGPERLRLRPPGLWWNLAASVLLVPLFALIALGLGDFPGSLRVVYAVIAAVYVIHLVPWCRSGVVVDDVGLTARLASGRTRRVGWADVHHVEKRGFRRGVGIRTIDVGGSA